MSFRLNTAESLSLLPLEDDSISDALDEKGKGKAEI